MSQMAAAGRLYAAGRGERTFSEFERQRAEWDRAFAELSDFECSFDVGQFHLYEHGDDRVWRPVRSFDLGG